MSQQALADLVCSGSRQLVYQWEKGETDPRKHIGALSRALEMPVEYFHDGTLPPATLEAKIKRMSPQNRDFMDTMADKLLEQQEAETDTSPKKA